MVIVWKSIRSRNEDEDQLIRSRNETRISLVGLVLLLVTTLKIQRGPCLPDVATQEVTADGHQVSSATSSQEGQPATTTTVFDELVKENFQGVKQASVRVRQAERNTFDINTWTQKTQGGLYDEDRQLLSEYYGRKNVSVFEFGLGESTYLANHLGVANYAGVDSDPVWVSQTRAKVSDHFRFYFADIGPTKAWGYPERVLDKATQMYQLAPLAAEAHSFDVYLVDGRYRVACMLSSFLHASARGAPHSETTVLLHDCRDKKNPSTHPLVKRNDYFVADDLVDYVGHSGGRLCVYKRKSTTTDEQLWAKWKELKNKVF